jgi:hypothetical protein
MSGEHARMVRFGVPLREKIIEKGGDELWELVETITARYNESADEKDEAIDELERLSRTYGRLDGSRRNRVLPRRDGTYAPSLQAHSGQITDPAEAQLASCRRTMPAGLANPNPTRETARI